MARYSYSTVGYGVFTLLGEKYRIGRIEVYDEEDLSGYAVHEGMFWLPFNVTNQVEDMFESLETDLPIYISLGSADWCRTAAAESLEMSEEDLSNPEVIKAFYKKMRDET